MSDLGRRSFLKGATSVVAALTGAGLSAPVVRAASQLSDDDIIRAWKDEAFRNSLTSEQRAQLPNHPAGSIEIEDQDLDETILIRTNHRSHGRCCY